MIHSVTINELIKPKYAFITTGVFFIIFGYLLLDMHLVRIGNILLFIYATMCIKSLDQFRVILLFFIGFIISFWVISLGILIEAVALIIWSISGLRRVINSPVRIIHSLLKNK
ncbi:hypothetical protein NEPAR06_1098 [Nematocida parisii]|uniref:Uncharacterized protein n=1 Tax=Nematocida parisii (strain ERTm3) TaxID=935791 RepID=I3EII2_NEMP3|nr:uncharacterized protein NEPG_01758 [Nematocida parisii ERTm1]EIJ89029.1 hypothetical protein NEQG_00848 [Nematocida parisii ERTm3]KAI5144433.1 hypothetical protein NEPAR07_1091 [Nematocida parisii]EIJ93416.1 hypothetical protein NEPG_01758 [Nematocida parisii ERTm1]KAI5154413.1 hypothetical protein NEPAR06_1098 [Nematocida parisii]KAI5157104.1 hypothetical protein NEPAR05_1031 [Nematocida parisii]|eukprot:XP_013059586.1 hypothetical protein NEPG_01758 [Nematocida parisii ERTm1]